MAQHPQQHSATGGTQIGPARQVAPAARVMSQTSSPGTRLAAQRLADLLASVRSIGPSQQAGIMSGPGNQGTANTAQLMGHAGTGEGFGSVPRQLKVGQSGSKPA